MNSYIVPKDFQGLVFFEEEHPLNEREALKGQRYIIIYHTSGENLSPLKNLNVEIIGDLY